MDQPIPQFCSHPKYDNWESWTEEDFEEYREWCKWILSKNNLVCRECWHLHCHPEKCTIQKRVKNSCQALILTNIFPEEICEMIASKIPDEDKIT